MKSTKNYTNAESNMHISAKTIEEIADQLDCGMKCYLNKITGAIIVGIPDEGLNDSITTASHDGIKEIDVNPAGYIEFEEMSSRESFSVMVDFIEEMHDESIKATLFTALNSKNPFRNFKSKVDDSESCRQKWFAYKRNKYVEYVRMQIPDNMLE